MGKASAAGLELAVTAPFYEVRRASPRDGLATSAGALLLAAEQPTEDVADRTALLAADHAAEDAAERVVPAAATTTAGAAEDAAQDVAQTATATGRLRLVASARGPQAPLVSCLPM